MFVPLNFQYLLCNWVKVCNNLMVPRSPPWSRDQDLTQVNVIDAHSSQLHLIMELTTQLYFHALTSAISTV